MTQRLFSGCLPMTKPKILQEGASYTFRSYFELPSDTDEVLAEFGYRFERQRLQLSLELIVLAMLEQSPEVLYGVLTIGEVWVFGKLERSTHTIVRDIGSYALLDDLAELVRILVGILE